MLAVFRRELRAYFVSPIGFVFVGFFILIAGVFFAISNLLSGNPSFTGVLSSLTFIFLFLVPILTMRLISEETRQKTDQLLITSPLSITGIVLGKYLAAVGVFVITLLITVLFPVIMSFFALLGLGWWEILGGYIGFLLMGCAFISIGLFFSSLTDNQLIAAMDDLRGASADLDTGFRGPERARRTPSRGWCSSPCWAWASWRWSSSARATPPRRSSRSCSRRPSWCSSSSSPDPCSRG